ncbi:MAG TPA: IS630 family transposase [Geobacterales bacterium]|jgi:transposase|nr:IS630 family transposase [Geobacterales bacterium]
MIAVRQDQGAQGLRLAARLEKMGKVVLRLLGIAHILDGRGRAESAALVGLEPQSLARAVDRYNAEGIAGLKDRTIPGRPCKLSSEQSAELKRIVLAGPEDRENGHPEFKIRHIVDLIEKKWGIRMSAEAMRTKLHSLKLEKLVCRPVHHKTDPVAQAEFKATFPERLAKIAKDHPEADSLEVWVQDEVRVGQKGKVVRRWAEKGSSPRAVVHGGFKSAWLFGAFCPARDTAVAIVVEAVNAEAMSAHLAVLSQAVPPKVHAVVLVDRAGFHTVAKDLIVPSNMTLVDLPAYSPELNPAEGVWEFLKGGVLAHRLYRTVDEIIDKLCWAWQSLINEPGRIRSLCSYDWLMVPPAPT